LPRARPPLWLLLGTPLLIASLVLSYRRSFWIAAVFALLLVLLLATTPNGRRMLVPASLLIAGAIWVLGSIGFQSQSSPLGDRVASLAPSRLAANKSDRYRIDERANVLGEIRDHPISGLGLKVPWSAAVQPLPLEHENGRDYVHFAPLWFWLKLGILGLAAYFATIAGGVLLSWRVWREQPDPMLRAFGIASVCSLLGLVVMDTTASFTGVDARLNVLLGIQLGFLAVLAMGEREAAVE
ncbi:MAG TPA: O-antigen ligase family protein, partial [Conexibacter sp.]|nr:O-antigen ligase family protein [Conexibacter sp.]